MLLFRLELSREMSVKIILEGRHRIFTQSLLIELEMMKSVEMSFNKLWLQAEISQLRG